MTNKLETKNQTISNKNALCVFGTYEWADETVNIINGCKHDCKYCYSKSMAIRFKRKTSKTWKNEEIRNNGALKYSKKVNGTIMYPSSHDIHPDNLEYHVKFIKILLERENKLLIVTKPHIECIKMICDKFSENKNKILFRFTIGSSDAETLKFWEPGAPDFKERHSSLKYAYKKGYQTSVSCEPMLDSNIDDVIRKSIPFVTDAIWLGKANYLIKRLKINGENGRETIKKAYKLVDWQSNRNILKLYNRYKDNSQIKWKESIKNVVGLTIPTVRGLDI